MPCALCRKTRAIKKHQVPRKSKSIAFGGGSVCLEDGPIVIREMTLQDVSGCYALGQKLFSFSPSLSRTFDKFVVIQCYSDPIYCLVAEHKGKLIGFILGSTIIKNNVRYGYIDWIAVEPEYQREGIATKLFNQVEQRFIEEEEISEILVDTPETNHGAIMFLESLGFTDPIKQVYYGVDVNKTRSSNPIKENNITTVMNNFNESTTILQQTSNIIIRTMEIDDLWDVFQIGEQVFTSQLNLYRFWDECQVTEAYEVEGELAIVAEQQGKVVGFALGSTLERKEKFGYLIWLAVSPTAHGKGIGTKLYYAYERQVRKEYPEINSIIIDTQESNTPAIKFFSRLGFQLEDTFVVYSKAIPNSTSAPALISVSTTPSEL